MILPLNSYSHVTIIQISIFSQKITIRRRISRRFRIWPQKHQNSSESWIIVKKLIFYFRRILLYPGDQQKFVMKKLTSYSSSTGQSHPGNQNLACLELSKCENLIHFCENERSWNPISALPAPVFSGKATIWSQIELESTPWCADVLFTHLDTFFRLLRRSRASINLKLGYENACLQGVHTHKNSSNGDRLVPRLILHARCWHYFVCLLICKMNDEIIW